MGTSAHDKVQKIRYRIFRELRRAGRTIPTDLAAHFEPCNECGGRGQVGYSAIKDGCYVEVDDVCCLCSGDGFVQVSSALPMQYSKSPSGGLRTMLERTFDNRHLLGRLYRT